MLGTTIIIKKKKPAAAAKLSLVALMDIFTILVFFLLLNSGDSQTLEDAKFVTLPDSSSEISPHTDMLVYVGEEFLWLQDKKIITVTEVLKNPHDVIEPLAVALKSYIEKHGELDEHEEKNGIAITVMGDKNVPYILLKSVMATCSGQNFRDISLAVNNIPAEVYSAASAPSTGG